MESKKKKEITRRSVKEKPPNAFLRFTSMTIQMAVIILIGVFGGLQLDEHFEMQNPVFTLGLSLLSVGAALYLVIKDISR